MFNIDVKTKIHNRFDIFIEDVETKEVIKAQAENIVLDNMFEYFKSTEIFRFGAYLIYGRGSGTLDATRTTLFDKVGHQSNADFEEELNFPPAESFLTKRAVIPAGTHTGETLTEVGLSYSDDTSSIVTHAFIEDSEGNPISLGPLTDTQQVTIFSTVYASVSFETSGMDLLIDGATDNGNILLGLLLGKYPIYYIKNRMELKASDDKTVTDPSLIYDYGYTLEDNAGPVNYNSTSGKLETNRLRFDTADANGKVWSFSWGGFYLTGLGFIPGVRLLLPSTIFDGFQFIDESIGAGDGIETEFILPWSDINDSKAYTFYVDGIAQNEGTDYTLSNTETETKITFNIAPGSGETVTGDWWVDYIPKDDDHVIDVTFTLDINPV